LSAPAIRDAREDDLAAVTAIYAHHVRHGTASFEIDPPDEAEIGRRRAAAVEAGLPWLVAEADGRIAGYAHAGAYRPRPAYRHTVEDSVYLAPGFERREMVAIIGDSANEASIALHSAQGFRMVGVLKNVGRKHDRWLDTVIMQLSLVDGAGL
jgi:phosphinothricin acetyltransferase